MTTEQALEFIARNGVVLESAQGPVPSLAESIAGGVFRGSWWSHPSAHAIHRLTQRVRESPDVLVCRLVNGKVTFVHRRLWPAIVVLEDRLPRDRLAAIQEIHTSQGRHEVTQTPFPDWVPVEVIDQANALDEQTAREALGELLDVLEQKNKGTT